MSELSHSPEIEELLDLAIESWLLEVHTCMPGKIISYDKKTQKADVQPMLKRRIVHQDGSELLESLPPLTDVPVNFMRSAGFFLTFPITKGDLVTVHFSERSMDNYMSSLGEESDPDEFRAHHLSDAICVPGWYPFKRPIKDISGVNAVFGMDNGGMQIHITPDGEMHVKFDNESDEAVALAGQLQQFWNDAFKPVFDSHFHLAPSGGGNTGTPITLAGAAVAPTFDTAIISKHLKVPVP